MTGGGENTTGSEGRFTGYRPTRAGHRLGAPHVHSSVDPLHSQTREYRKAELRLGLGRLLQVILQSVSTVSQGEWRDLKALRTALTNVQRGLFSQKGQLSNCLRKADL